MAKWFVPAMMSLRLTRLHVAFFDEPSILVSGICTAVSAFKPHTHTSTSLSSLLRASL